MPKKFFGLKNYALKNNPGFKQARKTIIAEKDYKKDQKEVYQYDPESPHFVLLRRKDKEHADRLCKFLLTFTMARAGELHVGTPGKEYEGYNSPYDLNYYPLVLPLNYRQYSTTIDQMQQAAQDFDSGYECARKELVKQSNTEEIEQEDKFF